VIRSFLWQVILALRGRSFRGEYARFCAIRDPAALRVFVEERLRSLLVHAWEHVPYYRRILEQNGVVRGNEVDLSRFERLPLLTKEIIRREELVSDEHANRKWYANSSGGATGEPVRLIQDHVFWRWATAASFYYYTHSLGMDRDRSRKVILWGTGRRMSDGYPPLRVRVKHWFRNQLPLDCSRMGEPDMARFARVINRRKPAIIRGYARSLYEFCRYLDREQVPIHPPRAVVISGESLHPDESKAIGTVLGAPVYDYYGSRETGALAGTCSRGRWHVLSFHNFMEIVDADGRPVGAGREGRVVVTTLHNYSMPLIRYDLGDRAVQGDGSCPCGSPLPTLRSLTGRLMENLVAEDGALVSGVNLSISFNLLDWVQAFQLLQEGPRRVRVLVVPRAEPVEADMRVVEGHLKRLLGQGVDVVWDWVEEIPKTPTGKRLYVRGPAGP